MVKSILIALVMVETITYDMCFLKMKSIHLLGLLMLCHYDLYVGMAIDLTKINSYLQEINSYLLIPVVHRI